MARKPFRPHYDLEEVRAAATGAWVDILVSVGGISRDLLDSKHHPCPRCGGADRFRAFDDVAQTGGVICNQCHNAKNSDGFAAIRWLCGVSFVDAKKLVAEYLGIKPSSGRYKSNGHIPKDPAKDLVWLPWNETLVALWCEKKKPIKPEAILAVGGRLAKYRGQWTVIALPVCGPELDHSKPIGWVLYNVSGKDLPSWKDDKKIVEWVKIKTMRGTQPGLIGVFKHGIQYQSDTDKVQRD